MKTLLSDDFHAALQKVSHVHQQCAEREARFIGRQRHQQIDVTGIIGVAPRHRPEHTYVGNTMAFSEGENPGAVLFDDCVHCYRILTRRPTSACLCVWHACLRSALRCMQASCGN